MSEKHGWRHAYAAPRDATDWRLITPGDFDIVSVAGVDDRNELLYFIASPDGRDAAVPLSRAPRRARNAGTRDPRRPGGNPHLQDLAGRHATPSTRSRRSTGPR